MAVAAKSINSLHTKEFKFKVASFEENISLDLFSCINYPLKLGSY